MGSLWLVVELRAALRGLYRTPGFVVATVVSLAIGIGGVTLVFSALDALVLRPLPYRDADQLVSIDPPTSRWEVFDRLGRSLSYVSVGAYTTRTSMLQTGDDRERVLIGRISEKCLSTLGVTPVVGRAIRPDEYRTSAPVALLTFHSWRVRFGGATDVVGRSLILDGQLFTIVGVLPEAFRTVEELEPGGDATYDRQVALLVPFVAGPGYWRDTRSGDHAVRGLRIIGRLRDSVRLAAAQSEARAIIERVVATGRTPGGDYRLIPIDAAVRGSVPTQMLLLVMAVSVLLLAACTNVANLVLERGSRRQQELAIRASLGASPAVVVRGLLIESGILVAIGGLCGTVAAWAGTLVLRGVAGDVFTRVDAITINWRSLVVASGLSAVAGTFVGVMPAIHLARRDLFRWLGAQGTTVDGLAPSSPAARLVVGEVAMAVALVVLGSLLARDFLSLSSVKTGFEPDGVLSAELPMDSQRMDGPDAARYLDDLARRVARDLPVRAAAITSTLPGGQSVTGWYIQAEGHRPGLAMGRIVSPDYFRMLSMPIVAGRALLPSDAVGTQKVVIVNEAFARAYWGGSGQATGKRIAVGSQVVDSETFRATAAIVVGVVASVREHGALAGESPETYWPLAQSGALIGRKLSERMVLLVGAKAGTARALAGPLREWMRRYEPHGRLYQVVTLEAVMFAKLARQRWLMSVMVLFGGLTLVLAILGVYSVVTFATTLRRREFGIRIALGCPPRNIIGIVLWWTMRLTGLGIAVGLFIALGWAWFASSQVFAVTGTDPGTCLAAVALVLVASSAAALIPAWRVTRIEPARSIHEP